MRPALYHYDDFDDHDGFIHSIGLRHLAKESHDATRTCRCSLALLNGNQALAPQPATENAMQSRSVSRLVATGCHWLPLVGAYKYICALFPSKNIMYKCTDVAIVGGPSFFLFFFLFLLHY